MCVWGRVMFVKDGSAVTGDEVWNSVKQCKQSTGLYVKKTRKFSTFSLLHRNPTALSVVFSHFHVLPFK